MYWVEVGQFMWIPDSHETDDNAGYGAGMEECMTEFDYQMWAASADAI